MFDLPRLFFTSTYAANVFETSVFKIPLSVCFTVFFLDCSSLKRDYGLSCGHGLDYRSDELM